MGWDFTKLPMEEWNKAIEAYTYGDIKTLVLLHNKYKLSDYIYCCSPAEDMNNWYGHAIDNQLIFPI